MIRTLSGVPGKQKAHEAILFVLGALIGSLTRTPSPIERILRFKLWLIKCMWSSFDNGPLERWMEQGKLLSVGENGSSQILKHSGWVVNMEGNYEKPTIWNWGRMKSTFDPALPSAPSSINTMTRLLAFRSSARLGHSLRFIVRDGGTNANGVIPTNGLITQNARPFCRGTYRLHQIAVSRRRG